MNTLEFFQGNLYAGGSFSTAGDIASNGIAFWNGSAWKGMDGGVNGFVNDIKASGDSGVVVGGLFTMTLQDTIPVRNIVWWTDEWRNRAQNDPFGGLSELVFVEGEVRSILVDGLDMWLGGLFNDAFPRGAGAQTGPLNNIALYNDGPPTVVPA